MSWAACIGVRGQVLAFPSPTLVGSGVRSCLSPPQPFHLVLHTRQANLSRLMRHVNGVYTQRFNRRHGLVGHLLQGRFKAILVDRDAYLLALCRYVERNPVAAGIVNAVADWPWSSHVQMTLPFGKPRCAVKSTWVMKPSKPACRPKRRCHAGRKPGNGGRVGEMGDLTPLFLRRNGRPDPAFS